MKRNYLSAAGTLCLLLNLNELVIIERFTANVLKLFDAVLELINDVFLSML